MKNPIKFRTLFFAVAFAAGLFTSCKDKETTVDESTTTSETTMEADTTSVPPVTEEMPGDTTTTGAPAGTPATGTQPQAQ